MNVDFHLDISSARLVHSAIQHEIDRLEFQRKSVGESDEGIDLNNDIELLHVALDRLHGQLDSGSEESSRAGRSDPSTPIATNKAVTRSGEP